MATTAQEQLAEATRLNFAAQPMQLGNEMRVLVQVADVAGMSFSLLLTQDAARALSKAIKEGVELAEVAILKPQSAIANA
jgi:hypothetical protein